MERSSLRNRLEYGAYVLARAVARALGAGALARVGSALGAVYAVVGRRRTRILRFNLSHALPEQPEHRRRRLERAVARHFGVVSLDALRIRTLSPEELLREVTVVGREHLDAAHERGQGVFLLSAHIGSWEVAALITGLKMEAGLSVINRPLDNPLLERELDRLRKLYGNHVFGKHNIAREMLSRLRTGGGVGILIDQRVHESQGVEVPFFGHPAWTHPILARVVRKTSAAVVPTFALYEKPGFYSLRYGEPMVIDGLTDAELEDVPLTTRYMKVLEEAISERPEQWLWYHDRWKQLRLAQTTR